MNSYSSYQFYLFENRYIRFISVKLSVLDYDKNTYVCLKQEMGSGGSKNTLADPTVNRERRLSHVDTNPPPTSDILVKV